MDLQIFRTRKFWVIFAAVAVIFFLLAINLNKSYRAEMDILLLPKNDAVARNMEHVIGNARQIPETATFYDALLQSNSDIEDQAAGLPDYKRRAIWDDAIFSKQADNSDVIRFWVTNSNQWQAELIARQSARNLSDTLSRYYNIRTELDVRIVDGPVSTSVSSNLFLWIFLSVIVGLAISSIISLMISYEESYKKIYRKENFFQPAYAPTDDDVILKNIQEEEARMFPEEEEIAIKKKESEVPIMTQNKKAAAPDNLPIADDFMMKMAMPIVETEKKNGKKDDSDHEPTPEEVRERLNKLLRGDV